VAVYSIAAAAAGKGKKLYRNKRKMKKNFKE
jgi:hypothetical protein